jgi:aspartate/methionine/tyrosine aminotransferase
MTFIPFHLEQWQSEYELTVDYNLADSGVDPVSVKEMLVGAGSLERLQGLALHYPPVNGSTLLRDLIAGLYNGAGRDNVLVTVGAAEANSVVLSSLLDPGDEVVVMEPGYRQLWGITQNLGCKVVPYHLDINNGWNLNFDELEKVVTSRTKLIGVTNPNNPTGKILTEVEIDRIVKIAAKHGAWIMADEVYRGTERLTDVETPSFYGRYDRLVATNSLSKAYGLSGLRIGWIVGPKEKVASAWRRHEYLAISAGAADMFFAELALAEPMRSWLIARTRRVIREGYSRLDAWIREHSSLVSIVPPESTALGFLRYHLDLSSFAVADTIRQKANVLVAPGDYFGVDHHLRITHGLKPEFMQDGLNRIGTVIEELGRKYRVSAAD